MPGIGGRGGGMVSGGGMNNFNESFDLDLMMPPDIASIDSDISKIDCLNCRQIGSLNSNSNARTWNLRNE